MYSKNVSKKQRTTAKEPKKDTPFGARVRKAMRWRGVDEAALIELVQNTAPGDAFKELREKSLTQQMVNHIRNGKAERSYFTPFIAAALGVSPLWLGWGIGRPDASHIRPIDSLEVDFALGGRRLAATKSG